MGADKIGYRWMEHDRVGYTAMGVYAGPSGHICEWIKDEGAG